MAVIPCHAQISPFHNTKGAPKSSVNLLFTVFLQLPPELRLLIWEFCLPQARNLFIQGANQKLLRNSSNPPAYVSKGNAPPLVFQICHESRSVALKHYHHLFQSTQVPSPGIWIRPKFDIIEFDCADFRDLARNNVLSELQPIQKLGLRGVFLRYDFLSTHELIFAAMPNLKILELVVWRDARHGYDTFSKVALDMVRQICGLSIWHDRTTMPIVRILDWGNGAMATLTGQSNGRVGIRHDGDEVFFSGYISWWHGSWIQRKAKVDNAPGLVHL
jgi:hypothetical protein